MPAGGYRTVRLEMYFQTGLQMSGYARWRVTVITAGSGSARNVSCLHFAGGVLRLPAEKTAISMQQTHSVGKK